MAFLMPIRDVVIEFLKRLYAGIGRRRVGLGIMLRT
jgi:hypothetical protein